MALITLKNNENALCHALIYSRQVKYNLKIKYNTTMFTVSSPFTSLLEVDYNYINAPFESLELNSILIIVI
jgi:hypothetical protein